MSLKIAYENSYQNRQESGVGANSLALTENCFVTKTGSVVSKATVGDRIYGVNDTIATYASDNQSSGLVKVNFTPASHDRLYRVTITGGTITSDDEGKFYNLSDEVTVNGATESATVTGMQLELVTFESATESIFRIVV